MHTLMILSGEIADPINFLIYKNYNNTLNIYKRYLLDLKMNTPFNDYIEG